jgi:molecular chaperone DnaJ
MAKRDYYEVLGVDKGADLDTMKKAYRKLALQYHPDRNPGDAGAEGRFKEVNEAYEVLKDSQKRAAYDQFGHAGVDPSAAAAGGYRGTGGVGFDIGDALRAFMREFGGFDLFGGEGGGQRPRDHRGGDRQIRLALTLEEIATGSSKKVRVNKLVPCTACRGRGSASGTTVTCDLCGGSGQLRRVQRSFLGQMVSVSACEKCGGEGEIVRDPCPTCRGVGVVQGQETISLNIPPGVMEGNYMTVRGHGDSGPRGGPAGDLIVVMTEKPHPIFERHGRDILSDLAIHPHQAVLGMHLEVPTLGGTAEVEIEPGTISGKVLRPRSLRGKGIPGRGGHDPGDHYLRVIVVTPAKLSTEERKLWEQLAKASGSVPPKVQKGFFDRMREAFGP